MKSAILGWGSLVWDPRGLPREGIWTKGGPSFPLEFARVSLDRRLTLVIDPMYGENCLSQYVPSPRIEIEDAVEDLRCREGTSVKWIGFVDLENDHRRGRVGDVLEAITSWCEEHRFTGAVWTDLPPNFEKKTGQSFSVENAVAYLEGLPEPARRRESTFEMQLMT